MICISIFQESRRLALVDMLNAGRQCDLLEVRLDKFGKSPQIGELLENKPKPIIFSCRRPQDGGQWDGTEEERLAILRQCIISKADYVEIELDAADQIRKFPPAKRVISYYNLKETPSDIGDIYAEAQKKNPDVIKLVAKAQTPEEAWPLVQILAKPAVPTVGVLLGKASVMLAVLGKKIGAPWTYAALERGMEAYPDQPTVNDLRQVYHYDAIERGTKLIGVTGLHERGRVTCAALNAAFAGLDLPARCLPVQVGSMKVFRKVIDAVRLPGVIVDEPHYHSILEVAAEQEHAVERCQAADLIVNQDDKWHAYSAFGRGAVAALENALRAKNPADKPLEGRMVMVVGTGPLARTMAWTLKKRGGAVMIAGRDRDRALGLAQRFECRHVPFEALYSTIHDVLVICDDLPAPARGKVAPPRQELLAGYLKPSMTVMDLNGVPRKSAFLREALLRGCTVVDPRDILLEQLQFQARLITGKEAAREPMQKLVLEMVADEE